MYRQIIMIEPISFMYRSRFKTAILVLLRYSFVVKIDRCIPAPRALNTELLLTINAGFRVFPSMATGKISEVLIPLQALLKVGFILVDFPDAAKLIGILGQDLPRR